MKGGAVGGSLTKIADKSSVLITSLIVNITYQGYTQMAQSP